MKQLVEVDVPDGWELACDQIRMPRHREYWMSPDGIRVYYNGSESEIAVAGVCRCGTCEPRVIVRPAWAWPSWLKAPWIAMDADGEWSAYACEPKAHSNYWYATSGDADGARLTATRDRIAYFDFTPPPTTDWKASKRKNPNL